MGIIGGLKFIMLCSLFQDDFTNFTFRFIVLETKISVSCRGFVSISCVIVTYASTFINYYLYSCANVQILLSKIQS